MKPIVSIIMPCYNAGKYLQVAIESVLNQSYENIELIVVNDGSTDNSLDILKNIEKSIKGNKKFSYYTTENKGQNAANNYGLDKANGKYVKFFDADDFLFIEAIEKQVTASEALEDNQVTFGYRIIADEELNGIRAVKYKKNNNLSLKEQFELIINQDLIVTACPLHLRSVLLSIGSFAKDVKHGNDFDLNLRVFLEGYKFKFDNIPVYYHRQHNSPDKLSSDGWHKKVPNFGFELLTRWEKLIDSSKYGLCSEAKIALANKHFKLMRSFIKRGNLEQSKLHLEQALKLAEGQNIEIKGSKLLGYLYKLTGNNLGYDKVEMILSKIKMMH